MFIAVSAEAGMFPPLTHFNADRYSPETALGDELTVEAVVAFPLALIDPVNLAAGGEPAGS